MGGMCDESARNVLTKIIQDERSRGCECTLQEWLDVLINRLTSEDVDEILGYSYQDSPHYGK